jgi:hypothetical protein
MNKDYTIVDIPESLYKKFEGEITKLNKKANKLGLAKIEYTTLDTYMSRTTMTSPGATVEAGLVEDFDFKVIKVGIMGEAPKLSNWEILAQLDHDSDKGNVVRNITNTPIPEKYRKADSTCDHCKQKRYRRSTYVLRHIDTAELKQVGTSCLKDFTGHKNPEAVARWYEIALNLITNTGSWLELVATGNSGGGYASIPRYFDVVEYLACAFSVADHYGYRKASDEFSTAEQASIVFHRNFKYNQEMIEFLPKEEHVEKAKKAIAWLKEVEEDNEYFHNLKVIVAEDHTTYRNMNFLASLYIAYMRPIYEAERKAAEKKVNKNLDEYFGQIKDKVELELTMTFEMSFDGAYGTTYMYLFKDADGRTFKWTASRNQWIEKGETVKIKGTIKDHAVYRDTKQTVLTRCKVIEEV